MRVLALDAQQLVLLPLQKRLTKLGYEVKTATCSAKGLEWYDTFKPDLLILDINMSGMPGLEIIEYLRVSRNSKTPIMVLTSNTDDDIIVKSFELGINVYLKKPLSLNEVCIRIKHLIGSPETTAKVLNDDVIIQQRCVGVVIPCYNEEKRLLSNEFLTYIDKHSGYHLCFVNDGSTDKTLNVLKELQKGREEFITIYDCKENGGKAEAVRLGMLHMAKRQDLDYLGFLDADLSTGLADFDDLVKTIEYSDFKIVTGSRISRMGAHINTKSARKIISLSINYIIRKILKMNFNDTQCGAKIFSKDVIHVAFSKTFVTQWIFDVEIFKRMSLYFGLKQAKTLICEQPLKRWVHTDDSKLSMKDSIKIILQLAQITWKYRTNSLGKDVPVANLDFNLRHSKAS